MKRGAIVPVALPGDFSKPRPALVLQTTMDDAGDHRVTLAPMTTSLTRMPLFRVRVLHTPANGLRSASDVMIDNLQTVRIGKTRPAIGSLEFDLLRQVGERLSVFFELESHTLEP